MANMTRYSDLPPLPAYTLTPREPLIAAIPDNVLLLILPIIAYWVVSLIFHWIDVNDYFSQYRLHTPAEVLKRNHVTRWDVVRDVVVQQLIQTAVGLVLAYFDEAEYTGKDEYNIMVWASRIRIAQRMIPGLFSAIGIDAAGLAKKLSSHPMLAAVVSGGKYPSLTQSILTASGETVVAPAFASWEISTARMLYWFGIPALQFVFATFFVDTWQYFLHRAMHMNKWLYTTFHARHHRLYVPYAFGALYNHPFEGFLLDTAGTGLAFLVTGMTSRQGMWFFTGSTIKTVDDHCGYAFPLDPLQHLTSNNAAYHDIHHQSWGIKTNFSQPFFTFWDRILNTRWTKGDVSLRYERSRNAAQKMMDEDDTKEGSAGSQADSLSCKEEEESVSRNIISRSVRRKTVFSPQTENLKTISHRLNGSIRQK
ncbi:hypothetical protein AJ79_06617 [Helicocarpus griseus UAMH5409]|uniref:Fatty acid hydroxylase domain-containing protein n=1 Tax=Helicocarpus griseus UAMH5409 TaxID=1447875 RepID=A0A2B7XBC6_9EURO|nr:hypothetical protein AJ79_06617 [Helicocarpus griseus UAMH5409]